MAKDSRFTFVNDPKMDVGLDEKNIEIHEEDKEAAKEAVKDEKKEHRRRVIKASIIMFVISAGLVFFGLLWQDEFDTLLAWGDALWMAFILEFFFGWVLLIYNMNIMSPIIYGFKSFFLMFVGKRPKVDYYHYAKDIYDNPIPAFYYKVLFTSAFLLLVPAVITLIILI